MMFSKIALALIVNAAVIAMAQLQNRYSPSNLADQCTALRQAADALCGNVIASCPIPPKNCTELYNFDFLFIMDESGSIESFNQNGFEKEKQFLKEFTKKYTIGSGPSDSRAGLIAFGTVANVEFLPGQYNSNADVNQQIDAIQFSSGNTNIRDALLQAADVATLPNIRRNNVPLIVLLLTDGKSNIGSSDELTVAAQQLRSIDGVELFAIGIKTLSDDGNSSPTYDKDELLNIVGNDESHFFEVESFSDLALSGDLTARDVCECVSTKSSSSASPPSTTLSTLFTGGSTSPSFNQSTTSTGATDSSGVSSTSTIISSSILTTTLSPEETETTRTESLSTQSANTTTSESTSSSQPLRSTDSPVTPQQASTSSDSSTQSSATATTDGNDNNTSAAPTTEGSVIFRTQEANTEPATEQGVDAVTTTQQTPIIVTQGSAITLGE